MAIESTTGLVRLNFFFFITTKHIFVRSSIIFPGIYGNYNVILSRQFWCNLCITYSYDRKCLKLQIKNNLNWSFLPTVKYVLWRHFDSTEKEFLYCVYSKKIRACSNLAGQDKSYFVWKCKTFKIFCKHFFNCLSS